MAVKNGADSLRDKLRKLFMTRDSDAFEKTLSEEVKDEGMEAGEGTQHRFLQEVFSVLPVVGQTHCPAEDLIEQWNRVTLETGDGTSLGFREPLATLEGGGSIFLKMQWEEGHFDLPAGGQDHRPLDNVFQLTKISGPGMVLACLQ